jgi:nicotinamidase-related amidase
MEAKIPCAEVENTGLLVVDLQERLVAAMPPEIVQRVTERIAILMQGARLLGIPILVTEQYPKGLGATVEALRPLLPAGTKPFEKLDFSCCGEASIAEAIYTTGRGQWIVCGVETHVCVFQTVRDLCGSGRSVFVPMDAVCSRKKSDWRAGLALMERCGAWLSSSESLLFDLLKRAEGDTFKAISKLVK